jgi:predicted  nucleic acid-binding Zn-ribbon protein
MKKWIIVWLGLALALFGCGEKADTTTPVAELEQEAETLTVDDLKAKASTYQELIAEKMQSLQPLQEKLKEIPLTEQMGEEARALQDDLKDLQAELGDLKDRLAVYVDALKEKGESVQDFLN